MQLSALELAHILNGTVEGDPSVTVSRLGKIESGKAGELCFLGNARYEEYAYTTGASILLLDKEFNAKQAIQSTIIRVDNVYSALAFLTEKIGKQDNPTRVISEKASIYPSVTIGQNVSIGDFTVIEAGAVIGDNCQIGSQVFIGKNCKILNDTILHIGVKVNFDSEIGASCILQANAVIGSDGFGFVPQADGTYKKIHHTGNVIIEDNVEIGANTTIDRASIGSTIIRKGVKLDNLIQIAHNVEIGENTVIAAQTGIAGSTKIGKNCRIGGQVGIVGHITIGDNVQIQAQSGVTTNTPNNSKLYGSPALGYTEFLKSYAIFRKLPEWVKKMR